MNISRIALSALLITTLGGDVSASPFKIPARYNRQFLGSTQWPLPVLPIAKNAPLPPMGWSDWNSFGDDPGPSDQLTRQIADALVSTGLKDCGYVTLLAFDGSWCNMSTNPGRDAQGNLIPDPSRWPNGVQAVSDYIHSKGLKVGGYSDIGEKGYCYPRERGMLHHEQQDADQFARWGWDYIKVDDHGPGNYFDCCRALANNSSHRPITISLSTPGTFPFDFAPRIANMWRVNADITIDLGHGAWPDICREFDAAEPFWWAQAPGRWNDLDMMVVGLFGVTDEDAKSNLNMWAIRGAPLILGCDLRPPYGDPEPGSSGPIPKISLVQIALLKNREVIAVDQDPLGASGRRVIRHGPGEVYAKPLGSFTGGEMAVMLLNRTERPMDIAVRWTDLGLMPGAVAVRDLWAHRDLGSIADRYVAKAVPAHGTVMLRVKGAYDWSKPRSYEAESSYNTFSGLAHQRCELAGFSGTAGVEGIGNGPENALEINRVSAPSAGQYKLHVFYACAQGSQAEMSVNGAAPIQINFPSTGGDQRVGMIVLTIPLQPGEGNTIRFGNSSGWAPMLDRIVVR